jgi:hypothetical protein
MRFGLLGTIGVATALATSFYACGKKVAEAPAEDKATTDTDGSDPDKAGTVAINPLASSYPEGLAVTSFSSDTTGAAELTAQTATAGTVAVTYSDSSLALSNLQAQLNGLALTEPPLGDRQCAESYEAEIAADPIKKAQYDEGYAAAVARAADWEANKDPSAKQRNAEAEELLKAEGDCESAALVTTLKRLKRIRTENKVADRPGDCYMPDWGILKGTYPGSTEVCMVCFTRAEMEETSALVDMALTIDQVMLCQAKKDGQAEAKVEDGETRTLTDALTKALDRDETKTSVTVKKAEISRSGEAYTTTLALGAFDLPGEMVFTLVHTPANAENSAYSGVLTVVFPDQRAAPGSKPGDTSATQTPSTSALSLRYSTEIATTAGITTPRVKYEVRRAEFKRDMQKFDADGMVDFNQGKACADTGDQSPLTTDLLGAYVFSTFDGFPELDIGKMAFWTNFGATCEEAARGFVFDLRRVDGQVKGCAIAGSAGYTGSDFGQTSIRKAIEDGYTLAPLGYWRPFHCVAGGGTDAGAKVWKQCFEKNETGKFVVDLGQTTDDVNGYDFINVSEIPTQLKEAPRPPKYDASRPVLGEAPAPTGPVPPGGPMPPAGPGGQQLPPLPGGPMPPH